MRQGIARTASPQSPRDLFTESSDATHTQLSVYTCKAGSMTKFCTRRTALKSLTTGETHFHVRNNSRNNLEPASSNSPRCLRFRRIPYPAGSSLTHLMVGLSTEAQQQQHAALAAAASPPSNRTTDLRAWSVVHACLALLQSVEPSFLAAGTPR